MLSVACVALTLYVAVSIPCLALLLSDLLVVVCCVVLLAVLCRLLRAFVCQLLMVLVCCCLSCVVHGLMLVVGVGRLFLFVASCALLAVAVRYV